MSLLIDGYNLLHASDVFPADGAPPTLEQSRLALLDFLVEILPPKQLARAIVVFDAVGAPKGLPREMTHRGLAVRFARRGRTADELIEELIATEPDPRNLLVVSSDHRLQRAARQRGAKFSDSEAWCRIVRSSVHPQQSNSSSDDGTRSAGCNPFPAGYADDVVD